MNVFDKPTGVDLVHLYANMDQALVIAQKKLEEAINVYMQAVEVYADAVESYRERKKHSAEIHVAAGKAITGIRDLVQGDTAKQKKEVILAEGNKKRLEKLCNAYELRIQTLKFISKRTENIDK